MSSGGKTPLHEACIGGHAETIRLLIKNGADVDIKDDDGWTPLHHACGGGHVETARVLIENGAEVHSKDDDGWTPLLKSCKEGHVETARLLIKNGADVGIKEDYGWTPLHGACLGGHVETARLLIENGADINSKNNWGETPLHHACYGGRRSIKIVQMLAHNGADLSLVNKRRIRNDEIREWIQSVKGFTPLHFACVAGDCDRVQTILLSGESGDNANVLSARDVASTKEVAEMMNKACQLWRQDINDLYPTSFQEAAEAFKKVFSEESRFGMVASNDAVVVELVLGYCERSWFRPESDKIR